MRYVYLLSIHRADHVRLTQQPACEVAAVQELIEAVQADTHAGMDTVLCLYSYGYCIVLVLYGYRIVQSPVNHLCCGFGIHVCMVLLCMGTMFAAAYIDVCKHYTTYTRIPPLIFTSPPPLIFTSPP